MTICETYKKISWVYEVPDIFENEVISNKRLDSFPIGNQKKIIFKTLFTLSKYFGQIPGSPKDSLISSFDSEEFKKDLLKIIETWISGLCDLSIFQIIDGLLNIINLRTEYQKWPPKSVMEFYNVCKRSNKSNNIINNKNISAEEKQRETDKGLINLNRMYAICGKDFKQELINRLCILESKKNKTTVEKSEYIGTKNAIKRLEIFEKMANIQHQLPNEPQPSNVS